MKKTKAQKGITLIALIITIVVLLILASVAINSIQNDGVIKYAQNAKEVFQDAQENENEKIEDITAIFDLHREESLVNKVKVGDCVEYKYTPKTYTTPAESTGKSVHPTQQEFNSGDGENADITTWRVLDINNGRITLVSALGNGIKLTMNGMNGYLNGPTVLNEMCKTLYSGQYGTARSISMEDINKATGYKVEGQWYYNDANGNFIKTGGSKMKTISELENELQLSTEGKVSGELVPNGTQLGNLPINAYKYNLADLGYTNGGENDWHKLRSWDMLIRK